MRILLLCTVIMCAMFGFGCGNSESDEFIRLNSAPHPLTAETESRLMATEGGRMLLRAIVAHGGLDAWHNAETSHYVWGFTGSLTTRMVAHNRIRHVYHDVLSTDGEVLSDGGQMVWDGTQAWVFPDSLPIRPRFMATTGYYFQSIPFILADPGVRYELMPPALLDSTEHHILRATFDDGVGDASGDHYTLYIHPETYVVNAIRYRSTFGQGRPPIDDNMSENLLYYMDYVTVDGLTVPTRFEAYEFMNGAKGQMYYEASSSEHSYTQPFDESRLVMPNGARIDPMPLPESGTE